MPRKSNLEPEPEQSRFSEKNVESETISEEIADETNHDMDYNMGNFEEFEDYQIQNLRR